MSANINLGDYCSCGYGTTTASTENTAEENKIFRALITIGILIVVVTLCGGTAFGGYGNYPGYGGFSMYGYTPYKPKKRYKYYDDYLGFDEPDF